MVDAGQVTARRAGSNPHLWFDPATMSVVAQAIIAALGQADPAHRTDYDPRLAEFNASLAPIETKGLRTSLLRVRAEVTGGAGALDLNGGTRRREALGGGGPADCLGDGAVIDLVHGAAGPAGQELGGVGVERALVAADEGVQPLDTMDQPLLQPECLPRRPDRDLARFPDLLERPAGLNDTRHRGGCLLERFQPDWTYPQCRK